MPPCSRVVTQLSFAECVYQRIDALVVQARAPRQSHRLPFARPHHLVADCAPSAYTSSLPGSRTVHQVADLSGTSPPKEGQRTLSDVPDVRVIAVSFKNDKTYLYSLPVFLHADRVGALPSLYI